MRNSGFRSALAHRFSEFITFKRMGGVDAQGQTQLLVHFDRFLREVGFRGSWPTRDAVERYMASTAHLEPGSRANRFSVVRQFCCYFRQFEPRCYVPAPMLQRGRRPSRLPHIYADREIKALLKAAGGLPPAGSLRPKTFVTLFGLLYATGLRCGEAFAFNFADVNLQENLLYVRKGKFGKSRWVPISHATSLALGRYIKDRSRVAPAAAELPLFITTTGRRLYRTNAHLAFRQVLRRCGLRGGKGSPGPRMHDMRHSFACKRLLTWYREKRDVNGLLPALATYLGHVKFTSTQVYLRATAELLKEANERFLKNFRQHVLEKKGEERC